MTSKVSEDTQCRDDAQKVEVSKELIQASKTCDKMKRLCQHVICRRNVRASEVLRNAETQAMSTSYELKQFELLHKAAAVLNEPSLLVACKNGLFEMSITLLEQGADETVVQAYYNELLGAACVKGSYDLAIRLIARGASLAAVSEHLGKLLEAALRQKIESVIEKIINADAPINELTDAGISFLYIVIS